VRLSADLLRPDWDSRSAGRGCLVNAFRRFTEPKRPALADQAPEDLQQFDHLDQAMQAFLPVTSDVVDPQVAGLRQIGLSVTGGFERYVEDAEDRYAQRWLPVEGPGACGSLRVASQLVWGVAASPDD
jgi:hypothetical protein